MPLITCSTCLLYLIQITVPFQPVHLRTCVSEKDITFIILETPRSYDEKISFPYPDPFLYLPLDSPGACNTVKTANTDVICTKHKIGMCKHFIVEFLRKPYPDDFISKTAFFLVSIITQLNNSIINDGNYLRSYLYRTNDDRQL